MNNEIPTDFPIWKPYRNTLYKLSYGNTQERKKTLRTSASSFTQRKDVRASIFKHKGNKCYLCGATATQIDHKKSVYAFSQDENLDYMELNSYSNLYPICAKCNASKAP